MAIHRKGVELKRHDYTGGSIAWFPFQREGTVLKVHQKKKVN